MDDERRQAGEQSLRYYEKVVSLCRSTSLEQQHNRVLSQYLKLTVPTSLKGRACCRPICPGCFHSLTQPHQRKAKVFKVKSKGTSCLKQISLNVTKAVLRKQIKAMLASMPDELVANKSRLMTQQLLQTPAYQTCQSLAIYINLPQGEPNTHTIVENSLLDGKHIYIPQVLDPNCALNPSDWPTMCMRRLRTMADLNNWSVNKWGIREPPQPRSFDELSEVFDEDCLDLIILPGLAFTATGLRLGRGGGFYDRYIEWYLKQVGSSKKHPCLLSLAFHEQIVRDIPTEPHDVKVDQIISA